MLNTHKVIPLRTNYPEGSCLFSESANFHFPFFSFSERVFGDVFLQSTDVSEKSLRNYLVRHYCEFISFIPSLLIAHVNNHTPKFYANAKPG